MSKIISRRVIELVDEFLKQASEQLRRVFPDTTFSGLCRRFAEKLTAEFHHRLEAVRQAGGAHGLLRGE